MQEASQERANEPRRRVRRRRHRSRPALLRRLLQPIWYEVHTMLRNPLYFWSLAAAVGLALLLWLAGVVLPSSDSDRFRPAGQGRLAR